MKKPSEPKPSSQQHSNRCVFVDRSLGSKKIPDAIRALGIRVEIHDDHFSRDEDDTVWLSYCGANGWIVLTKDERIRRDPSEIRAVAASGAHAIFIGRQDVTAEQMIADLMPALPKLLRKMSLAGEPLFAVIHKGGRVDWLRIADTGPQPRFVTTRSI
ncbi:MAG TPA: hypothetical protein VHT53_10915 [Candidatus Elarobacter sp.]|nr:hypothetical protein [Candidatus Elarobacter sp.]